MSKLSQPNSTLSEARPFASMSQVHPHAAGVDLGAHEIMVCVPGGENTQLVRSFGNYTADLQSIAAWLKEHHIETVAMESTGVYWIPLFETLEAAGFHCCLISSRSLRRIPGRKSDVLDCQWIQTLHSYGLLESSFRPEADLIALRTLLRHRAQLLEHRAPHVLHMQKALLQMNIQLSQALSDVTGVTGLAIIRAIVAGERDPHKLAALRNYRCHKDEEEIAKALTGTLRQAQGRPGGRSISSCSSNPWRCTTSTPARSKPATPRSSGPTLKFAPGKTARTMTTCPRFPNTNARATARTLPRLVKFAGISSASAGWT
ncbi:hypothetical protein TDMWS_02280 [Thermodesulfomicrobium sp. WS]|uniref:IS110 family transposase n=1 Tax=Thermodesulfomicrobium sp. WS TaxID=3004129 RepID=UPI0024929E07|nr:transposase [Thermodesulfomicrobium sp. WS]BDV00143.1 hypothetical protein TDMWS_02280 [Thermodesulfomicrobium sp. WS]